MSSMKRNVLITAAAAILAGLPAFLDRSILAAEDETPKLIAVLQSNAPAFEKAKACQKLAVVGTKDAIPVLAALLSDESLAHYARFGLEPIPDPAVDAALRDAMGKLKGKLLVGVINSIGARRDAGALAGLTGRLSDPDAEVVAAAAAAIGRIGTSDAAGTLRKALSAAGPDLRPAMADAVFACAEALLAAGKRDEAVALYDFAWKAEIPDHLKFAAARGAVTARQEAGAPLLIEMLQSKDYAFFALGLQVARELPGPSVTKALVAELGKLPPEKRALLVVALGDRGDATALPAVVEAAKSDAAEVRVAAMRVLERLGNASVLNVLLESAQPIEGEVAQAALTAVENIPGKEVDAAIVARLGDPESRLRRALIELAGRRRIAEAVPFLRKAADDESEVVRIAAIQALGKTVGLDDIAFLTARLVAPKTPGEGAAAMDALKAASVRMPDRDACAAKLLEPMAAASTEGKTRILQVFIAIGGPKSLEIVTASARDPDGGIRAAAVRTLGEWMSEDAAGKLLELVKGSADAAERGQALQAFSALVRRLAFPKEQRLGLCQEAMGIARNDEERKIVIETLSGIPAPETLTILEPYYAQPGLKDAACSATVTISERLVRSRRDAVAAALKRVLEVTKDPTLEARAKRILQQAVQK